MLMAAGPQLKMGGGIAPTGQLHLLTMSPYRKRMLPPMFRVLTQFRHPLDNKDERICRFTPCDITIVTIRSVLGMNRVWYTWEVNGESKLFLAVYVTYVIICLFLICFNNALTLFPFICSHNVATRSTVAASVQHLFYGNKYPAIACWPTTLPLPWRCIWTWWTYIYKSLHLYYMQPSGSQHQMKCSFNNTMCWGTLTMY